MFQKTTSRLLSFAAAFASVITLGGCYDVEYRYDIPTSDADCPSGMNHRSGGTGIVDRSGGSGIVDRNSNNVMDYCYVPNCPGGNYDNATPAVIAWHQDSHKQVVADRMCLALPPPPNNP